MELYSPYSLLLLLLIPAVVYFMLSRRGRAHLLFSSLRDVDISRRSWRQRFRGLLIMLRVVCIILLIIAIARPRQGNRQSRISTKGVAIELVVDISGSMTEPMIYKGKKVTRLDVVKDVLNDFVTGDDDLSGRENDLLGLVTYARYADTICPLILKHDILAGFLKQLKPVNPNSELSMTAIGEGVKLAAARLKKAEESLEERNRSSRSTGAGDLDKPEFEIQSKVIVLLTDGRNNEGTSPMQAAKLAKDWGIKIYTIGIGGQPQANGFFGMQMGLDLDEPLLKNMAESTGGFYGRADDAEALREIVEKIDQQEKTEIESVEYSLYVEKFAPWAWASLAALALEIMLGCTLFRKIP